MHDRAGSNNSSLSRAVPRTVNDSGSLTCIAGSERGLKHCDARFNAGDVRAGNEHQTDRKNREVATMPSVCSDLNHHRGAAPCHEGDADEQEGKLPFHKEVGLSSR